MIGEHQFIENQSGRIVEKKQTSLTNSDNMGRVVRSLFLGEFSIGQEKNKIQLISFIEKNQEHIF